MRYRAYIGVILRISSDLMASKQIKGNIKDTLASKSQNPSGNHYDENLNITLKTGDFEIDIN